MPKTAWMNWRCATASPLRTQGCYQVLPTAEFSVGQSCREQSRDLPTTKVVEGRLAEGLLSEKKSAGRIKPATDCFDFSSTTMIVG